MSDHFLNIKLSPNTCIKGLAMTTFNLEASDTDHHSSLTTRESRGVLARESF